MPADVYDNIDYDDLLPTANTLFSNVSNGTGLPDCSISFHSPVTPMFDSYSTIPLFTFNI